MSLICFLVLYRLTIPLHFPTTPSLRASPSLHSAPRRQRCPYPPIATPTPIPPTTVCIPRARTRLGLATTTCHPTRTNVLGSRTLHSPLSTPTRVIRLLRHSPAFQAEDRPTATISIPAATVEAVEAITDRPLTRVSSDIPRTRTPQHHPIRFPRSNPQV